MKHILVATDFSDPAAAALREAAKLAGMCGGRITLLHVIYAEKISETLLGLDALEYLSRAADGSAFDPSQAVARMHESAEKKLAEAVSALSGPRPSIETVVAEGRPSLEIARYSAANDVDLIVMGTYGRNMLGKAFLGSVADHVIRQADCPVMVVRK